MGSLAVTKIKSAPRGQECGGDRVSQDSVEVNLQVLPTAIPLTIAATNTVPL